MTDQARGVADPTADTAAALNEAWASYGETIYGKRTTGLLFGMLVDRHVRHVWHELDATREARLNARAEEIAAQVRASEFAARRQGHPLPAAEPCPLHGEVQPRPEPVSDENREGEFS